MGGWDRLHNIYDPIQRDITREVLSLFSFDHFMIDTDFDEEDTIYFWAFGQPHGMSLS